MSEQDYAPTPIPVKKPRKFYLGVLAVLAGFFIFQVSLRFLPGKKSQEGKGTFVEDPNRTLFKEEDIRRSLTAFGKGAKESYLSKLRMKEKDVSPASSDPRRQRLGPVTIVKHEEAQVASVPPSFKAPEPIGLPLGTKMLALLKDKIFSFNVENQIEAELLKDVYYLGKLRLPKGTKFFGNVSIVHSEDRVNIRFYKLLLPWGEEREVRAVAHSLDGSGGLKGKVHRQFFKRFFSVAGKTTLGALTLFTIPNRQNAFSIDDQLRLTAAGNLSQEAQRELDSVKIEKAITVDGSLPIQIVLLESL